MAFKAKDLHYEKQEPEFLRKLRGQYGGDRHNVSIARPSKSRLELGEDDGPTIVDESGTSLTKEEYEAMAQGKPCEVTDLASKEDGHRGDDVEESGEPKSRENDRPKREVVASIGASNKRKQARVIGEDPGIDDKLDKGDTEEISRKKAPSSVKPKAKRKKVKLSFDEDGG